MLQNCPPPDFAVQHQSCIGQVEKSQRLLCRQIAGRGEPFVKRRQHQKRENGGAERDRTADLLHAMQALSQLSYSPISGKSQDGNYSQFRSAFSVFNQSSLVGLGRMSASSSSSVSSSVWSSASSSRSRSRSSSITRSGILATTAASSSSSTSTS